ncbi:MAG: EpsI family protein [Gemmataceae bacterium]|nr:EpsI family protein [Gemmataceae bacterium]
MPRRVAVIAAVAILFVCGLVHGLWAERWHTSRALTSALERVALVPLEIGDWRGEALEGDHEAFETAGAQRYWIRSYTNARTRQTVLAILMCGRAGRMAIHTPQLCYPGAVYEMDDAPVSTPMTSASGEALGTLNTARLSKTRGVGSKAVRLYWGWNPGDGWHAPSNPRWTYSGRPFLYKLYVSESQMPGNENAAAALLQELLPELRKTLSSGEHEAADRNNGDGTP